MRDLRTGELQRVPKLTGADIELGNFILGASDPSESCRLGAEAVLAQIDGLPVRRSFGTASDSVQDRGRKFLPSNGGCAYIDLDHLELCIPETLSAWDHLAAWHAMLNIAQSALARANALCPEGLEIQVLVNNSDVGVSYGSHLNILVTRRTWENLFRRRLHHALWLAAFQASSIIYTGQGKLGAQNGCDDVDFQISQRADWFETLIGVQTTFERPIVNSRDEPLCGVTSVGAPDFARLHVIFYDSTLSQVATLLKVGVMQLIVAMIEADAVDPRLLLDDPLSAVGLWSRDIRLERAVPCADGRRVTAVQLQFDFLERARRFAESGRFDGIVPRSSEILALWEETLRLLESRDLPRLGRRLDWVRKLETLERTCELHPELDWKSAELRHLDYLYASLDPRSGLYWAFERGGAMETVVSVEDVERFVHDPPEDTRAWTRAMLLRSLDPVDIDDVNWDQVRVRATPGYWSPSTTVALHDPLRHTRGETEDLFTGASTLDDVVEGLALIGSPSSVGHFGAERTERQERL